LHLTKYHTLKKTGYHIARLKLKVYTADLQVRTKVLKENHLEGCKQAPILCYMYIAHPVEHANFTLQNSSYIFDYNIKHLKLSPCPALASEGCHYL
jgi:hypothetical protein